MAQPTAYTRQYDFSDWQATNPSTPLPSAQVDNEFDAVKTTLDETLDNLALIQRDDGALANLSVGPDQLSTATRSLLAGSFTIKGDWATATSYILLDVAMENSTAYLCVEAHTSGTFATDLAAGKWIIIGFEAAGDATSALASVTPAADRVPYFTGADTASVTPLTAAARTLLDDTTVSAMRTTLGLDALALKATVNNDDWSGADLAVTNGGTGSSSASAARTALGVLSSDLSSLTAATVASGDLIAVADIDDSNNPKKVTAQSIANLASVATDIPTGTITMYAGAATAPSGWLLCDGSTIGKVSSGADLESAGYETLFDLIKGIYGGTGSEIFSSGDTVALPDLRGRSPLGVNDAGLPNGASGSYSTRNEGDNGGEESHVLTTGELAAHSHANTGIVAGATLASGANFATGSGGSAGSDTAHNTMHPFLVVNFIVKV